MDEEGRRNNRSPNQRVTTVPIYDFPSIRECVEVLVDTEGRSGCEARFGRIVNEQLQRYRSQGIDPPDRSWLDPRYLYRINYGPASRDDVEVAYAALKAADHLPERGRLTLLDRRIAHEFSKTVFPAEHEKWAICIDWTLENEEAQGQVLEAYQHLTSPHGRRVGIGHSKIEFGRRLSPFELNPFAAESEVIRACEEFCVNCVWDNKYASAIFGDNARPPMAAVATDMMNMVTFLSRMPHETPRLILECLRDFLSSNRLYSIAGQGINADVACRGFLWDMFMIVVCCPRNYRELEGWDRSVRGINWQPYAPFHEFRDTIPRATDYYHFPGGEVLGLPASSHENKMAGYLDGMNADYIHSGPYRLHLTNQLREHLTLDDNRRIRLYWDDPRLSRRLLRPAGAKPGRSILRTKPAIPGDSISLYSEHVLGRLLNADRIAQEIMDSYSVLFSRSLGSEAVARKLFEQQNMRVDFVISFNFIKDSVRAPTPADEDKIRIMKWYDPGVRGEGPLLGHFEYYRPHLALLMKQMSEWKPQRRGDLLQVGYNDRFTYYSTIFGVSIAVLGLAGVISTIIGTVVAWLALNK